MSPFFALGLILISFVFFLLAKGRPTPLTCEVLSVVKSPKKVQRVVEATPCRVELSSPPRASLSSSPVVVGAQQPPIPPVDSRDEDLFPLFEKLSVKGPALRSCLKRTSSSAVSAPKTVHFLHPSPRLTEIDLYEYREYEPQTPLRMFWNVKVINEETEIVRRPKAPRFRPVDPPSCAPHRR